MLRHLIFAAAFALAAPAVAQTVSGCGTTAIAKASLVSKPKLTAEATCFGKARDTAVLAVTARQAQIAKLSPAPTPPPVITPAPIPAPTPTAALPGPIGMNLVGLSFYSSEVPFIDRMNNSQGWLINVPGQGLVPVGKAGVPVGGDGIPTTLPSNSTGWSYFATSMPFDELGTGTTRRYVLFYDGDFVFGGGPGIAVVDRQPGKITFTQEVFGPQQMIFPERFNNVHNIHVVREDQLALFQAGKTFNPAFLDRVKRFSPIRFMDWQATNNQQVVHWADRQTLANTSSWANNGGTIGEAGVPVEVLVQLANEAHVEPWFCIPAHADDDYIRQFATYVRDHLDPALRPHFEYSNEVWNGSFEQARWAESEATRLFGGGGSGVFYGYRAAQAATIIRSVMGERARMVISAWTAWPPSVPSIFEGIAKVGDVHALFDEYAITTYWGAALAGENPHDVALILGWAKGGQAGIDAAFDALEKGGVLQQDFYSLPALADHYVPHAAIAKQYGLDLVAYEGGFGADAYYGYGNDVNTVYDFIRCMKASPRMAVAIKRMSNDFVAAGGKELTLFNDVGDVNWGATRNIYATSPTLETLKEINAQP